MFIFFLKLCPLADQILDLYTKYDYDRLPEFVLLSWFKRYSKGENYNHNCLSVKLGQFPCCLYKLLNIHTHVHVIDIRNIIVCIEVYTICNFFACFTAQLECCVAAFWLSLLATLKNRCRIPCLLPEIISQLVF